VGSAVPKGEHFFCSSKAFQAMGSLFSSFVVSILALFPFGLNLRITLGVRTRFHGKRDRGAAILNFA